MDKKDLSFSINISDQDVYEAMKDIPGYLDITAGDFKELYHFAYRKALSRLTRSVTAKEVMTKAVISVDQECLLMDVARVMAANTIAGVPVIDGDKKVVGVISEKDFLSHMGAEDTKSFMAVVAKCLGGKGCVAMPIRAKKARDIMTSPAITVHEDRSVKEVAGIFTEKGINRVPVIDAQGCLTGIVSRADIVHAFV